MDPSRRVTEGQRALELKKFFSPCKDDQENLDEPFNEVIIGDAALSAYAERLIWRLHGDHAMVSLIDRAEQWFIAGATRVGNSEDGSVTSDSTWFGSTSVPTPGGLCENTLQLEDTKDPYPCFIINDLSLDARFASLPLVDGSLAAYRFYAGTPITTNRGINIGSLFMYDAKPRPNGLSSGQREYLHQQAANVMELLETKRQAADRRRVMLMSQGIATFLEKASLIDASPAATATSSVKRPRAEKKDERQSDPLGIWKYDGQEASDTQESTEPSKSTIGDKISMTLKQAAIILRQSLELNSGGVVFLDTSVGYTAAGSIDAYLDETTILGAHFSKIKKDQPQHENEIEIKSSTLSQPVHEIGESLSQRSIKSSTDKHNAPKVQAISAAEIATSDLDSSMLDGKTLQSLLKTYPKGNVWYIDDKGFFSSLDQINDLERFDRTNPFGSSRTIPASDVTKQMAEATLLSQIFHKARQIIFLPLWDAAGDRWYSGCFVWSQSAVPVFTVESEIAYLSAFTNTVTVELSRLDAMTANKMKSDFISSISHEFRSPLHGILASADFLRESDLDASQIEFVSTILNCSGTLLDTINHVLDYSKINSFNHSGTPHDTISNELYQINNLALLCEDLVNGMIVAGEFRGAGSTDISNAISNDLGTSQTPSLPAVEIILDIEHQNWDFRVQAGALRRIVMNIFGNAQKYTKSGYILVQVGIRKLHQDHSEESVSTSSDNLVIHVRDTGIGMSHEYMERKLYRPFAQEDNFATGVGLGLSIVRSIVNQLRGKILIRSELGKGTDVEVTIPVKRPDGSESTRTVPDGRTQVSEDAQRAIQALQARTSGKRVLLSRTIQQNGVSRSREVSWSCIERYCSKWFNYEVISRNGDKEQIKHADLIICDQDDELANVDPSDMLDGQRILVVHSHNACRQDTKQNQLRIGGICAPIGPFKLARCILALLDQDLSSTALKSSNMLTTGGPTPSSTIKRLSASRNHITDVGITQPPPPSSLEQDLPSVPLDSTSGLHILVVDDNLLNLRLIHRYLLKHKSDFVSTAHNGAEAVVAVREAADKGTHFDIIFMDILMPEMDGFEATRQIRRFENSFAHRSAPEELDAKSAPTEEDKMTENRSKNKEQKNSAKKEAHRAYVVALTGLASRRDRDEAEASGFDDFLTKPVSFQKIEDMLKRLSTEKIAER